MFDCMFFEDFLVVVSCFVMFALVLMERSGVSFSLLSVVLGLVVLVPFSQWSSTLVASLVSCIVSSPGTARCFHISAKFKYA